MAHHLSIRVFGPNVNFTFLTITEKTNDGNAIIAVFKNTFLDLTSHRIFKKILRNRYICDLLKRRYVNRIVFSLFLFFLQAFRALHYALYRALKIHMIIIYRRNVSRHIKKFRESDLRIHCKRKR